MDNIYCQVCEEFHMLENEQTPEAKYKVIVCDLENTVIASVNVCEECSKNTNVHDLVYI